MEVDGIELLWKGAGSTAGVGISVEGATKRLSAVSARLFAVICVAKSITAESSNAMSTSVLSVLKAVEGASSLLMGICLLSKPQRSYLGEGLGSW